MFIDLETKGILILITYLRSRPCRELGYIFLINILARRTDTFIFLFMMRYFHSRLLMKCNQDVNCSPIYSVCYSAHLRFPSDNTDPDCWVYQVTLPFLHCFQDCGPIFNFQPSERSIFIKNLHWLINRYMDITLKSVKSILLFYPLYLAFIFTGKKSDKIHLVQTLKFHSSIYVQRCDIVIYPVVPTLQTSSALPEDNFNTAITFFILFFFKTEVKWIQTCK